MSMSEKLFCLSILTLPFLAVSPLIKVLGVPTGIVFGLLVLVSILVFVRERTVKSLLHTVLETPLMKPLLLFLLVNLVSLARAGLITGLGRENYIEFAYLAFSITVFWLTANVIKNEKTLAGVLRVYFIASLISVVWSLYVTLGYMAGLDTGQLITWTVPRLFGTAAEPQVYGNYLLSVIPPVTVFLAVKTPALKWFYLLPGLTLLVLAMVMTFSAGAWVGLASSWVMLLIGFRQFKLTGMLSFAGCLTAVAIILIFINSVLYPGYSEGFKSIAVKFGLPPELIEQVVPSPAKIKGSAAAETYHLSKKSVYERQGFRQAAWRMFRAYPVIGVGTGNFGYLYNTYKPGGANAFPFVAKAHNQYLEVLAETGVVGFGVFLSNIFLTAIMTWRAYRAARGTFWQPAVMGAFAGLAGIAVQGYFFGFLVHIYTWVLLGFLAAAYRLYRTNPV